MDKAGIGLAAEVSEAVTHVVTMPGADGLARRTLKVGGFGLVSVARSIFLGIKSIATILRCVTLLTPNTSPLRTDPRSIWRGFRTASGS